MSLNHLSAGFAGEDHGGGKNTAFVMAVVSSIVWS